VLSGHLATAVLSSAGRSVSAETLALSTIRWSG
jgi:hypothetical protein